MSIILSQCPQCSDYRHKAQCLQQALLYICVCSSPWLMSKARHGNDLQKNSTETLQTTISIFMPSTPSPLHTHQHLASFLLLAHFVPAHLHLENLDFYFEFKIFIWELEIGVWLEFKACLSTVGAALSQVKSTISVFCWWSHLHLFVHLGCSVSHWKFQARLG